MERMREDGLEVISTEFSLILIRLEWVCAVAGEKRR